MMFLKNTPKGCHLPFCPNGKCKFHHHLVTQWHYKRYRQIARDIGIDQTAGIEPTQHMPSNLFYYKLLYRYVIMFS